MTINCGDRVKDRVTGYSGIVMSITDYLHGCQRCSVQSERLGQDGKPMEWEVFDVLQLDVVEPGAYPPIGHNQPPTGGPRPDPRRPDAPRRW